MVTASESKGHCCVDLITCL